MRVEQQKVLARFAPAVMFPEANTSVIELRAVAMPRHVLTSAIAWFDAFAQDQLRQGTENIATTSVSPARTA
jgi:hypothetical protein